MLDKGVRILNFDNSITRQYRLISQYQSEIIDLTGLAPYARLYMSGALRKKIAASLSRTDKNFPVFLGSGDFHHISEIFTSSIDLPFCLVVFDSHPDWDILLPRFGCGSWVTQAMRNKNIVKTVLLGVGSGDLRPAPLMTGNLAALRNDRLEIYPYNRKSSRIFFRHMPDNNSTVVNKGIFSEKIVWHNLEKEDLREFALKLVRRLPSSRVYISIDKDCLTKEFALTNWEEGGLRLDQLLAVLRVMRENLDIIGLDIAGDYSVPGVSGMIKAVISWLDHPAVFTARDCPDGQVLRANEDANLKILGEIFS